MRRSCRRRFVVRHPLGPVLYREAARNPTLARVIAAVVLTGCVTLLGIARSLTPDVAGLGTHLQLGIGPCSAPMLLGFPCPTCGMTTAFAHAARGALFSAFHAQPAGLALALAAAGAAVGSLCVLVSGKIWVVNWYRVDPTRLTLGLVAILLSGWMYKLAAGVMTGTLPVR